MRKHNKKIIITFSTLIVFTVILNIKLAYADGFSDTIVKMIGEVIAYFADGIVWLCDALGGKFDKLIFNYDGSTFNSDLSMTLLKNNDISKQVIMVYELMRYIGTVILVSIVSIITLDFLRAGNDVRHKAVLKSRLERLILSIVLLNGIPNVVDLMLAFNTAVTDAFRVFTKAMVANNSSIDFGKSFLTSVFSDLIAKNTGKQALIISVVYLISALINLWLIIFYMIRDLTITFLFIFAPILVCLLPFRADLIIKWFKEMFSNIITQAIQAVVFTVIIAIVAGLSSSSDLYSDVFALVAFAMFIPITAIIKNLLGLEGNIGVAKSAAGLGAAVMTMALAGRAASGIKNKAGMLKDGYDRIKGLSSERDNLDKLSRGGSSALPNFNNRGLGSRNGGFGNLSAGMAALGGVEGGIGEMGTGMAMASMFTGGSSYGGGNFNQLAGKQFPRDRNTIQGEISSIRKQAFKSLAGGAFSAAGAGVMAVAGSAFGPMGAFMGMQMGSSIGESMGSLGATGISKAGSALTEKGKDVLYGKGVRPELSVIGNGNKSWELGNIKHNMNNMKNNFTNNMNARKSDMQYGWYNSHVKSHTDEEKEALNVAREARQDELTGLTGDPIRDTEYYQNEKDSRLHTQKLVRQGEFAKASRYRLQTSSPNIINEEGLKSFENNIGNPEFKSKAMLYTDKNSSILFNQNSETGAREVLATLPGNPSLDTPTMESVEFDMNGSIPVNDTLRSNFREQAVNVAVQRYGENSISDSNDQYYNAAQNFIQKETNNLINQHVQRNEGLRQSTGSSKIHVTGNIMPYENVAGLNSVPNSVPPDVSINIPNSQNLNTQHQKDVFSNIEMGRITLNLKQAEYLQQRQYTDSLAQGASEIYNTYNRTSLNTNRKM
ncbi:hypothetical protein [uncultured Clostridium sp.]|uniref:hypothetical protein n=1 Tax=uncultured Clostridium sp. TaxID=59620 RepID=UPI0028E25A4E|nr:hypothetical protein [uncultured Clostridium sp.]